MLLDVAHVILSPLGILPTNLEVMFTPRLLVVIESRKSVRSPSCCISPSLEMSVKAPRLVSFLCHVNDVTSIPLHVNSIGNTLEQTTLPFRISLGVMRVSETDDV